MRIFPDWQHVPQMPTALASYNLDTKPVVFIHFAFVGSRTHLAMNTYAHLTQVLLRLLLLLPQLLCRHQLLLAEHVQRRYLRSTKHSRMYNLALPTPIALVLLVRMVLPAVSLHNVFVVFKSLVHRATWVALSRDETGHYSSKCWARTFLKYKWYLCVYSFFVKKHGNCWTRVN